MQTLTPDLLANLRARYQAGEAAYHGRLEIDRFIGAVAATPVVIEQTSNSYTSAGPSVYQHFGSAATPALDRVFVWVGLWRQLTSSPQPPLDGETWEQITVAHFYDDHDSPDPCEVTAYKAHVTVAQAEHLLQGSTGGGGTGVLIRSVMYELSNADYASITSITSITSIRLQDQAANGGILDIGDLGVLDASKLALLAVADGGDGFRVITADPRQFTVDLFACRDESGGAVNSFYGEGFPIGWWGHAFGDGVTDIEARVDYDQSHTFGGLALVVSAYAGGGGSDETLETTEYVIARAARNVSKRLAAAELEVEIDLADDDPVIVSPDGQIRENVALRLFQWYGDNANEVRSFTGLADEIVETRDPRKLTITARDMMKPAIVEHVNVTAPQGAGEAGAVRTAANGVYLNMEASDIVSDLLTRWAGYDTADLDITPTSYLISEYIVDDDTSVAEAIIGDDKLTGLTGYALRATELGRVQFVPSIASKAPDSDTSATPDYSYLVGTEGETWAALTEYAAGQGILPTSPNDHLYVTLEGGTAGGVEPSWPTDGTDVVDGTITWTDAGLEQLTSRNVVSLRHGIDGYDLKTRVKVTGNLGILTDAWTELWHTSVIRKPTGVFYDSATPTYIRVCDGNTHKVYKVRQSDRHVIGTSAALTTRYLNGISGDPADATIYWILEAPWVTGSTAHSFIHKVRKSDNAILASYDIGTAHWTDIKADSSWLYLPNFSDAKIYRKSKADGSTDNSYSATYGSPNQPTGIAIDGADAYVGFYGKNVMLKYAQPAFTSVLRTLKFSGTKSLGGDLDTTTHTELYATAPELGLVYKFTLYTASTRAISTEVVDSDLEDELGFLSSRANREHDTHPTDPDHPYEIRRDVLRIEKILDNVAQATETAQRRLAIVAHRREVLDYAMVGNPGLQLDDLLELQDVRTGIDAQYVLDTYRDDMGPDGYFGQIATLPYDPVY